MALTLTTNYDNAANFTFNATDIEIAASQAQLALQYVSQASGFSEDFTSSVGFTIVTTAAIISSGMLQPVNQTPSNSIMGNVFTDKDLSWRNDGGFDEGTLNGSPTFGSGQMVCTGSQGVFYSGTSAAQESIKFKYTPNYTTAPPANINIIMTWNGTNNNNRFGITHSSSGNTIRAFLANSTGTILLNIVAIGPAWTPTASQQYEFEVVIDSAAGTFRVFIDGVLHGTLSPGAWTRGVTSIRYYVGASPAVYNRAEGSFDDFVTFDNAQHTASYTPGYTLPLTLYEETVVTMPTYTYPGPGFVIPGGAPTSTQAGLPQYIIQDRYWNGSAWVVSSDTYITSMTLANAAANIGSFPDTSQTNMVIKIVLPETNTLSTVSQFDMPVDGQEYAQDAPNIKPNTFIQADGLDAFAATVSTAGADEVRFVLETRVVAGGVSSYWWFNGGSWVGSDQSFAQSNTAADFNTNFPSFPISTGLYARVLSLLYSDTGLTTPAISQSEITYNFFVVEPEPRKVILYGWFRESDDTPKPATVKVQTLSSYDHTDIVVLKSEVSTTTDSDGYFEIEVYETETVNQTVRVRVEYTDEIAGVQNFNDVVIPDQDCANLADLIG